MDKVKLFFNHFLTAVGVVASIVSIIASFGKFEPNSFNCAIYVLLLCFVYALCRTLIRKKKIQLNIAENFQLSIEKGNLFQCKGTIVIPVNNYFDTIVGDDIIIPKSIHGQFINNYFLNNRRKLDQYIEESLREQNIEGIIDDKRVSGKTRKYPLGTCAEVKDGGNRYILVVTTEFSQNNKACLERRDFIKVLNGLFCYIDKCPGDEGVYMPILGSGCARLNRSSERILHYIIDYLEFSLSDKKILGGVHIVYISEQKIDLNRVREISTI